MGGGGGTSRNIFKSKLILFESYYSSHRPTGENFQLGGGQIVRELDVSTVSIISCIGYPYSRKVRS